MGLTFPSRDFPEKSPAQKYFFTACAAGFALALDQASKVYVHTAMKVGESKTLIPGFFNFTYARNTGGAFGFGSESHELIRAFLFLLVPLVCAAVIFFMLRETRDRLQAAALAVILGGAAGNYMDRIRLGYVVDFIDWHLAGRWRWPTFNLADSFIVTGAMYLGFVYFREYLDERRRAKAASLNKNPS